MTSFAKDSFGFGRVLGTMRALVLAFAFLGASLIQPVPAFSDTRAGLATAEREPLAVPAKPVWSAPAATAERAAPPPLDPPAGDGVGAIPVVDFRVPATLAVAAPVPGENRLTASTSLPPDSTGPPSA